MKRRKRIWQCWTLKGGRLQTCQKKLDEKKNLRWEYVLACCFWHTLHNNCCFCRYLFFFLNQRCVFLFILVLRWKVVLLFWFHLSHSCRRLGVPPTCLVSNHPRTKKKKRVRRKNKAASEQTNNLDLRKIFLYMVIYLPDAFCVLCLNQQVYHAYIDETKAFLLF